ncbi:hypothetical protein MFLAVUS_006194 [Mucor flavus]|uniref:Uncharacterized protein n=1 Tax=Mucor flavus TaxID=439312 RepID=A0ABP9Z0X3_9FUNG
MKQEETIRIPEEDTITSKKTTSPFRSPKLIIQLISKTYGFDIIEAEHCRLLCVHTVLDLDGKEFEFGDIDQRWYLDELDYHPITSSDKEKITASELLNNRPSWYALMSRLELKFCELEGSSEQTSRLENTMIKALEEHEVVNVADENIIEDFIEMPTTEDINNIGRSPKEVCHRPTWKKNKSLVKSRADQIELKVTTGKFKTDNDAYLEILDKNDNLFSGTYVHLIHPDINLDHSDSDAWQQKSVEMKMLMRDVLLANEDFYRTSFGRYITFDSLKRVVCFGLEEVVSSTSIFYNAYQDLTSISAPSNCWFYSAACMQLAADTFRRPIAAYAEIKYTSLPELYFPVLSIDYYHVSLDKFEMLWPRPALNYWKYLCHQLIKSVSYKRSAWSTYLHFVPKQTIVSAQIEDVIDLTN